MHETGLVATVAFALGSALLLGFAAKRLGLSPILGYLLAGIAVGPRTPGFVADYALASQLAEIGVVLLMFGVGLHFSAADLLRVRGIAVPGALVQSAVAAALGLLVAHLAGWSLGAGVVLGVALSVASTVVLVRGLADQRLLESPHGHAAIGWLIVEDLFTVLVLVILPALAGPLGGTGGGAGAGVWGALGLAVGKVAALALLVLVVGSRVIPWLLVRVARLESRELFTLAVLAVALGIAYGSAVVFDVSMALGAFLAGMVVAQSDLSHRAAADALPLRDAFAVLFFVSVGMLFDPALLLEAPWLVLATLAIVLVAKPLTALGVVLALGHPVRTAVTAAVGLAQIGEFSFILAALGRSLGLFPAEGQSLVLAVALISIALNPFLFRLAGPMEAALRRWPWLARRRARARVGALPPAAAAHALEGHAILCGHGRVGVVLADVLKERGWRYVVIDQRRETVERIAREGVLALNGDAANPILLDHAGLAGARMLLVALPDPVATALLVAHAAKARPDLPIVVRVEGDAERRALLGLGRVEAVVGTQEAAFQMVRHLVAGFGLGPLEGEATVLDLRRRHGYDTPAAAQRFVELEVGAGGAGRRVADLGLPPASLLVAIRRGGDYVVPGGRTVLAAGDHVLALLSPSDADVVARLLSGTEPS
jgi:CPA2 family monovalent cation:H+ antiporter-2